MNTHLLKIYRLLAVVLILVAMDLVAHPAENVDFDSLVIASEVKVNGEVPSSDFWFKPGRILNNRMTIWFCGYDESSRETFVFHSNDGGFTFMHNATAIRENAAQMDAFDDACALVAMSEGGKIWRTDDGGVTWKVAYSYNEAPGTPGFFDGLRVLNNKVAVACGDGERNGSMHFVRTEDKGITWKRIEGIDYMNAAYSDPRWGSAMCNIGDSVWSIATTIKYDSAFVFRSYDSGITWQSFRIPKAVLAYSPVTIAFIDKNKGMISDRWGNIAKSTDGGATWSIASKPPKHGNFEESGLVAIPNSNIILAMHNHAWGDWQNTPAIYYTTDLGATWNAMPADRKANWVKCYISGVFYSKDFGYAFDNEGHVARFKNQLVTSVQESGDKHNLPNKFALLQNYPNPFNFHTTIEFSLAKPAFVTLKVFNLRGQQVAVLLEKQPSAEMQRVNWNASGLASGVYLYRLEAGEFVQTQKLILIQ